MEETVSVPEVELREYPPLIKRFQSVIIDQVFIIVCMFIFSSILPDSNGEGSGILRGFLLISLFLIYEPVSMVLGCTLGNNISGIRVRNFDDENKKINLFQAYVRFIVKLILGIISFFTVTSNRFKRAIHDMAAGSIMLYAKNSN